MALLVVRLFPGLLKTPCSVPLNAEAAAGDRMQVRKVLLMTLTLLNAGTLKAAGQQPVAPDEGQRVIDVAWSLASPTRALGPMDARRPGMNAR